MDVAGRGVQSIEVGGRLLAVMASAGRALMLRDISGGAKVTPAQAHAYLVSFRKIGLVEQVGASGLYQLGPFALQLGLARLRSLDAFRLTGNAVVDLANELGLMVTVTVWGSFGATIVQVQEGTDQVHVNLRAGAVYSVTGTATGRLFAAFLPPAVIAAHLDVERREGTHGHRVGNPAAEKLLIQVVAETQRLGYTTAVGSPIPGVNAISAPVFNHTGQMQLAVTLIGPTKLVDVGRDSMHIRRLLGFTKGLSAALGFDHDRLPDTYTASAGPAVVVGPCISHPAGKPGQKRRA